MNGIQEVRGSIPLSSIEFINPWETKGFFILPSNYRDCGAYILRFNGISQRILKLRKEKEAIRWDWIDLNRGEIKSDFVI